MQGEGPMFRIGAIRSESVDHDHDPNNPNCFAWCLMNLCIAKILQASIRKILNTAGLEVLGRSSVLDLADLAGTNPCVIVSNLK